MLKQFQQFDPDAIDPADLTVERQPLRLATSQLLVIRFCHQPQGILTSLSREERRGQIRRR